MAIADALVGHAHVCGSGAVDWHHTLSVDLDRHRMMDFFGLLPRASRSGTCRGHGSAHIAVNLILSCRAGESRCCGNIAVLPLALNQVRCHVNHRSPCNRLWMTCIAVWG
jgi:hypothetical protein